MIISSRPIVLSRPQTASELERAIEGASTVAKLQPSVGGAVSLLGSVTGPLEMWDVGKAGLGFGEAGQTLKVLGGVSVAVGAYKSVRGLLTNVTPEAINEALKPQNGGRDLNPADAQMLASKINSRARVNSTISLGNAVASGAAIATGNLAAGLVAIALKVATIGSAVSTAAKTVKDIESVLQHQPAPAPQPTQTAPNPATQP